MDTIVVQRKSPRKRTQVRPPKLSSLLDANWPRCRSPNASCLYFPRLLALHSCAPVYQWNLSSRSSLVPRKSALNVVIDVVKATSARGRPFWRMQQAHSPRTSHRRCCTRWCC